MSIRQLRQRLDKLTPPPGDDAWLRQSAAYHRIFEVPESEQRAYSRMLWGVLSKMSGVKLPDDVEQRITDELSTENLRGTEWERFVTDWKSHPGHNHHSDNKEPHHAPLLADLNGRRGIIPSQ